MANHVLLETIELTQNAATVTFDNIPQTGYTDLKLCISSRNSYSGGGAPNSYMTFNGSSTGYSGRYITGNGTSISSAGNTGGTSVIYVGAIENNSWAANTFGNLEIYITNYTLSSNKFVSWDSVTQNTSSTAYTQFGTGLWANSAAITSITFTPEAATGDWLAGSTFSLYGIAATGTTPAIAPYATGGNIVANDGTYWYHAFLNSGTFTPQKALTCDALVIAGGGGGGGVGGGGYSGGGGGGAGGYLSLSSQSFTTTSYPVAVGAGGAGGIKILSLAVSGSNSQIGSLTSAVGGGFGGTYTLGGGVAGNGGSGGGMSYPTSGNSSGTSGQGNAGGARNGDAGGGGGGAGAAGQNAPTGANGGNGGAGSNAHATWATATSTGVSGYFAGGGGGGGYGSSNGTNGSGGSGGGGSAVRDATGGSGTTNTGSGGGGVAGFVGPATGGAGGSGIVIIRYAM